MKAKKWSFFAAFILIAALVAVSIRGFYFIPAAQDIRFGIDIRGGVEAIFEPADYEGEVTDDALQMARTVIETRLDAKNILDREVTIDSENNNILVRFPWKAGETSFDPEQAISELGEMARLTFRDMDGNVLVEGKNVAKSYVGANQSGYVYEYQVALEFDSVGAQLFSQATSSNIGKQIGIYMDDTLISAPTVNTAITDGNAVITGDFTFEEAKELSDKINSGGLPFALTTRSFSTITPTLAESALNIMLISALIAYALICLFMIIRYRLPGFISCIALAFQAAVQILAFSITQITLTLPGIAGMILAIGMGVDANIIIAERIGEELRNKASVKTAIQRGYKNAFSSVFDGNITTLAIALLLIFFGSGTMLSFGYTLAIGIIMNFVAGVFTTRIMLNSITEFKAFRNLKLFFVSKERKTIRFYKLRKIAYALSAVVIILGIIPCFTRGVPLDVQFKGGIVLKYDIASAVDSDKAASVASSAVGLPLSAQTTTDFGDGSQRLVVTLAENDDGITPAQQSQLTAALSETFPDAQLSLEESYSVAPYIGQKTLNNALIAIGLSALFIILYVWVRFKKISGASAGVMALVALVHDILIVFSVFAISGFAIGSSFVAVVLTIIGYSINDTIVVYDRIRENRRLNPNMEITELVDTSVTQSVSRSVFTSISTILSVATMLIMSYMYGIDSITTFALPLLFGLISGCYSTLFIATPLWVSWRRFYEKRKNKQGA